MSGKDDQECEAKVKQLKEKKAEWLHWIASYERGIAHNQSKVDDPATPPGMIEYLKKQIVSREKNIIDYKQKLAITEAEVAKLTEENEDRDSEDVPQHIPPPPQRDAAEHELSSAHDGGGTTPAASESVPHKDTPPVAVNISKESSTISAQSRRRKRLLDAYKKVLKGKSTLNIRVVRINHLGLPRSGKTYFRRRLRGEIVNILDAIKKGEQPELSVKEEDSEGDDILIRTMSSEFGTISLKVWSALSGFGEEANLLSQLIFQAAKKITKSKAPHGHGQPYCVDDISIEELFPLLVEDVEGGSWDDLEDIVLLINTDAGGQAELLGLHSSLVQGPSINLLYSRLIDELDSQFKLRYTTREDTAAEEEYSTITEKEMLFQSLSAIACFSGCFSDEPLEASGHLPLHSKSKVMFLGTHRDKVTEEEFREKDDLLQQSIRETEFYDKGIVEFASEDRLMLAVDNRSGGQGEIDNVRGILQRVIEKNFEKIPIPASWLLFSLCIRKKKWRVVSLKECEDLARKLNIDRKELQTALWFLHHCVGILLYYPEVESLKDTVICDIQVLFDSSSTFIRNTFTFEKVGKSACEKFREKGQFSLDDLKDAMRYHPGDLLPLEKLVQLLHHLNIVALISLAGQKPQYFMPSVLRSARNADLGTSTPISGVPDSAPLMVRFDCGYVPVGVFPAVITNLISQQLEGWKLIEEGLCKNRIQFCVGDDYDTVSFFSHPQHFEISIVRREKTRIRTESLCAHVRSVVQSALATVISHLHYSFNMGYRLGFRCPVHPEEEHLCVLNKETATNMQCLQNLKRPQPVSLEPRHKVWFSVLNPPIPAPSMKFLNLLKWKDERGNEKTYQLVNRVSGKWMEFGIQLHISLNQLDGWRMQNLGNATGCWYKVMESWLSGAGGEEYPATWEGLYALVSDVGMAEVSKELRQAVQMSS